MNYEQEQAAHRALIERLRNLPGIKAMREAEAEAERAAFWARNPCGFPGCPKHSQEGNDRS